MRLTTLETPNFGQNVLTKVTYSNTGSEPISTAEAKSWAKIDSTADDTLIGDLITQVIDTVENELNLTIVDKTVTAVYESFDAAIPLPFAPVSSITSVKTLDQGTETTLTADDDYRLQGDVLYMLTRYKYKDPWNAIGLEVVYDCAWGTLPDGIVLGLKKAILSNYEDRQDVAGGLSVVEMPNSSWKHLKRYKNY